MAHAIELLFSMFQPIVATACEADLSSDMEFSMKSFVDASAAIILELQLEKRNRPSISIMEKLVHSTLHIDHSVVERVFPHCVMRTA